MKDVDKQVRDLLWFFEQVYFKLFVESTIENKSIELQNKNKNINNIWYRKSDLFDLEKTIKVGQIKSILEDNPDIKGFKLYFFIFENIKDRNKEIKKDLTNTIKNFDFDFDSSWEDVLDTTVDKFSKLSNDDIINHIKLSRERRRITKDSSMDYFYFIINMEEELINRGQRPQDKLFNNFIEKEIRKVSKILNFINHYDNEPQHDDNTLEKLECNKRWNEFILSKLPKKITELDVSEHMFWEFKNIINNKKRQEKTIKEILEDDTVELESRKILKNHYLEAIKKVNKLKVNKNYNQKTPTRWSLFLKENKKEIEL